MLCSRNSFVFLLYYLTILTAPVCECGQLPSGQGRNLRFSITGFTIPAAIAYTTEPNVPVKVSSISRDEQAAKSFVQNPLMRSVEDVLEQEGSSASLPDAVISAILQQLTVNISYTPIKCNNVETNAAAPNFMCKISLSIISLWNTELMKCKKL